MGKSFSALLLTPTAFDRHIEPSLIFRLKRLSYWSLVDLDFDSIGYVSVLWGDRGQVGVKIHPIPLFYINLCHVPGDAPGAKVEPVLT